MRVCTNPAREEEKKQLPLKRAALRQCLRVLAIAEKERQRQIVERYTSIASHSSIPTINQILTYNAKLLEKLLRMWGDCPDQTRETLSPGPIQFTELSKKTGNYEGIKFPHLYFGFTCDMYICCFEQGQTLQDSNLVTACNAAQLSIHITNKPDSLPEWETTLTDTIREASNLMDMYEKSREKEQVRPEEWRLKADIQRISCKGMLATLQMFAQKESRISVLRDLEIELIATSDELSATKTDIESKRFSSPKDDQPAGVMHGQPHVVCATPQHEFDL